MVWGKIYANEVTSDDQSFDTGTFTASTNMQQLFSQNGHTGNSLLRFNGDTGSNYTERCQVNGATDSLRTSGTSNINVMTAGTGDDLTLTVMYMINISGEEKLSVYTTVYSNTAGAGTAPLRVEGVSKWANTSAQITQITISDSGNGFDTGSNLSVLGDGVTPAAEILFGENVPDYTRFEETDTRKMYSRLPASTVTFEDDFSSDSNWTQTGSEIVIDTTTDMRLEGSVRRELTNHAQTIDLQTLMGEAVDSTWVARFKLNVLTYSWTAGSATAFFTFSDSDGTVDSVTAQDHATLNYVVHNTINKWKVETEANSALSGTDTNGVNAVTAKEYWMEWVYNDGELTINIYDDANYSVLDESIVNTAATTPTGLRYFKVQSRYASSSTWNGSSTFAVDDFQFYNGVTSLTSKPTNVPDYTRFEETDTRKMYSKYAEYKIHSFTSSGTFQITAGSGDVEYLVVAGGGGSGTTWGSCGGAGAGGFRTATGHAVTTQSYSITVGAGGASGSGLGGNGGNSIFDTITSTGGGGGGQFSSGAGASGGSGGGGGDSGSAGAGNTPSTTPSQGNNGGAGTSAGGGGGGGSGAVGGNGNTNNGGVGTQSSITGTSIYYAGGGGGSNSSPRTGGDGGGGNGGTTGAASTSGTDGLGGGAGGGGNISGGNTGGSGIVIVKYNSSEITATGGTITTIGGWKEKGTT